MFERLESAVADVRGVVAGLDASLLSGVDAAAGLRLFAELETVAAAGRILLARRVDETAAWGGGGYRSVAEWMAHLLGTSVGSAKDDVDTSWNLGDQPDVAHAVRAGELSKEKASAVSRAAKKAPDAEKDLVSKAKKAPLSTVRDECNKAKARAEDPATRAQRCHKARRAGFGGEVDGMIPLTTWSPVAVAAKLKAVLEKRTDQIWRAKNKGGRTGWERRDRYMHDAVVDAILGSGSAGAPAATGARGPVSAERPSKPGRATKPAARTNVQIRIDLTALRRGWVEQGEICDAPGVGEITPREVELLLAEDDCIIDVLLTRGTDVLNHVRYDRYIPIDIRRALELRDPTCVAPGCNQTHGLEIDHILGYAITKRTKLDELARMCRADHRRKTIEGWILARLPDGGWSFEPPNTEGSLFADAQPGASP